MTPGERIANEWEHGSSLFEMRDHAAAIDAAIAEAAAAKDAEIAGLRSDNARFGERWEAEVKELLARAEAAERERDLCRESCRSRESAMIDVTFERDALASRLEECRKAIAVALDDWETQVTLNKNVLSRLAACLRDTPATKLDLPKLIEESNRTVKRLDDASKVSQEALQRIVRTPATET